VSQESGLYNKWKAMAQKSRSSYDPEFYKSDEKIYESETLTLIRLRGVFGLLLLGYILAIILFNFEYFSN